MLQLSNHVAGVGSSIACKNGAPFVETGILAFNKQGAAVASVVMHEMKNNVLFNSHYSKFESIIGQELLLTGLNFIALDSSMTLRDYERFGTCLDKHSELSNADGTYCYEVEPCEVIDFLS